MTDGPDAARQLELDLLDPATRGDRARLERLLDESFVEIGSRGERLDRDAVIAGLVAERSGSPPARHVDQLEAVSINEHVVLVTYRVRRIDYGGATIERWRSSIWRRRDGRWRMVFHQGTPIVAPAPSMR